MDVDIRPLARRQLLDISDWTAGRFGELQAERYLRQLSEAIERVAVAPYLGPIYRGRVRRIVSGSHLIYYEIHRDRIVILRVDHGRQRRH
jgi:toxin ParE1/3/4